MPKGKRSEYKKRLKARLRELQEDLCYWCKCEMVFPAGHLKKQPRNLATIDHLYDKLDPLRLTAKGKRLVLACLQCNHQRGAQSVDRLTDEEKWQRSGRFPKTNESPTP